MRYIDTHTHLDFPVFAADRTAVIEQARRSGVTRLVVLGVSQTNWREVWDLSQRETCVYAALGLHPVFVEAHRDEHLTELREWLGQLAGNPKCCAVGEIGLDYFVKGLNRERQQHLLEAQLALAADFDLPALLHVRRAHAPTIALLKHVKLRRAGIVHAFSGSQEEAREYIRLGFKIGLGGAATWPQAKRMHRVLAQLPIDSLVLETDSPDMAPAFYPHQRNTPGNLPRICEILAMIRQEPADVLARACLQNSCELFGWDPSAMC
ncbi:TatD family hydrolase [Halopseudomonas salina]|uniref:TatD-related deoxyribonuclease n=1 Tax=Halopseudomonas salina TaxID=1323744 RepID=A0ABQ1PXM1_9GAMM|nr:TatD family hydrolase [Halopseudomonas salina]GGD05929.1 TatD-related deoxyribonuclease [Halopseudomonas salina]